MTATLTPEPPTKTVELDAEALAKAQRDYAAALDRIKDPGRHDDAIADAIGIGWKHWLSALRHGKDPIGVSETLVYGWVNSGEIAHLRLGTRGRRGAIRIGEDDLEAFLQGRRQGERQASVPPPSPVKLWHINL